MASDKHRRKVAKKSRKPGAPHPDGDRRRKEFGAAARQATADKKARREFWGMPADQEQDL